MQMQAEWVWNNTIVQKSYVVQEWNENCVVIMGSGLINNLTYKEIS